MTQTSLTRELRDFLSEHKYTAIARPKKAPEVILLARRRGLLGGQSTFAVVETDESAVTLDEVKRLRKVLAFHLGFIPMLYELGINLVIAGPNVDLSSDPRQYVAKVNTFWAMVQSVYLLNTTSLEGTWTSSWGQVVSGRIQERVAAKIAEGYQLTRAGE